MLRRPGYDKCTKETACTGDALTLRQKLSLVVGTSLKAETLVDMQDDAIDFDFLIEHGVGASVLRAAGVTVPQLRQRGVDSMGKLAQLGYTTLHLTDGGSFCSECVSVFGADSVLSEYFSTASDAIILAGSAAVSQLGLDTGMLLLLCANKPAAAREVITQCSPRGQCLHGVPPVTLIETGLKAIHLNRLGYDAASVREQTLADPSQMAILGF
jgi:hypothetical protein